jgi:PTH1 family peptidyl-tRNA hydrolase
MNFGRVKIVYDSSSGGHNGIKDIERCLGSKKYTRLKIGIANNKNIDTKDYVLGKLDKDGKEKLEEVSKIVNNILDDYFQLDFNSLMNKYNHK